MPWSTCAAGSKPFTTNFWESEVENETTSICTRGEISSVCDCGGAGAELCGHAFVELADAAAFRAASDQFRASARPAGAQQAALGRIPRPLGRRTLARPHDGAMGANDARGTRQIPRRNATPLRPLRASVTRAEDVTGSRRITGCRHSEVSVGRLQARSATRVK